MSTPETAAPKRRGGLGALLDSTQSAPDAADPAVPPAAVELPGPPAAARPSAPPAREPRTSSGAPLKVGDVAVLTDRRGRQYIPKSVNVPLDIAVWIQQQLGVHRRDEDGAVTHKFQDVMIDMLRAGRTALEKKQQRTE